MIDIEEIQKYVKQSMSTYRFNHTLGVVGTAKELSFRYGASEHKAIVAALLHDVAKEFSTSKKRNFCKDHNIYLDEYVNKNINLSHGMIGAHIARIKFNIQDEDILQAIANHTFGRKNMSTLEKIIYLSDIIEPNRMSYPGLEELRDITYQDLDRAMEKALNLTIIHLNSKNKQAHPVIYSMLTHYTESNILKSKESNNDRYKSL